MVTALAQPKTKESRRSPWAENYANYPGEADLPSEYYPMENSLHALQTHLLRMILSLYWKDRSDYFIGDNLTIYFSLEQTKKHDFRGPDLFVAKNTDGRHRNSWPKSW